VSSECVLSDDTLDIRESKLDRIIRRELEYAKWVGCWGEWGRSGSAVKMKTR